MSKENGFAPLLLILLAAVGLILYLLISNTFSFKDRLFSLLYPKPTPQAQEQAPSIPDEILLKFKPVVDEVIKDKVLTRYGLSKQDIQETIPGIDVALLKVPQKAKDKLIEALNKNPNIEYAEPNYIRHAITTPNDPYFFPDTNHYPNQWALGKISAPQGWDISTGSSQVVIAILDTGVKLDHEDLKDKVSGTMDDNEHGTKVAGINASTNNSKGIAGVCWQCPLLSVKVLSSTGSGSDSTVASGITAAADSGAKVINLSLGGYSYSPTLQQASNYAWKKGAMVVAGSGNDGATRPFFPAAGGNTVAVGMTGFNDARDALSNYGVWLDVMAPGVATYTTLRGGGYGWGSGTSIATPHVSGLAGLIFSVNPNLSNKDILDIILQSTDNLGEGGFDIYYGWGRINVFKALTLAKTFQPQTPDTTLPKITITSPKDGETVSKVFEVKADASDNDKVVEVIFSMDSDAWVDITAPYYATFDFSYYTDEYIVGPHYLTATAYDGWGNYASQRITINIQNLTGTSPSPTPSPTPTPTPPPSDTTNPQTSITSPSGGSTVSNGVTIQASATDNVSVSAVSFFVDNIFIGEDFTSPYEMPWDTSQYTNGSHSLQSRATDSSGNIGESSLINVNVNNQTATPTPTPTLTPTPTSEPISTPTPNPILPDTINPTVSIIYPSDGAAVSRNSQVTIQASATDNVKISKVEFLVNNSVKCTDTVSPYTCSWKVPGKSGVSYNITAKAYDSSNNSNTSTITVRVQ